MTFELTESLKDEILFAMEDQHSDFVVDAENLYIVSTEDENFDLDADDGRYYDIPEWTSADGYNLMEDFTNNLHTPKAHADLKRVLISGRGVFRNFKDVLKQYPETERMWHLFKDEKMKIRITEWYSNLLESWGLEKLSEQDEFSDSTEDLVKNDFVFREFNPELDSDEIQKESDNVAKEFSAQYDQTLGSAIAFMWQENSFYTKTASKKGIICRSQDGKFIGCALATICPPSAKETVVITDFFVVQDYRGLGIAKELLNQALNSLKKCGIHYALIANIFIPQYMENLLVQNGFSKKGSVYTADLF